MKTLWLALSLSLAAPAGAPAVPAPVAAAPAAVPSMARVGADKVKALVNPANDDLKFEEVPWRPTLWSGVLEAQQADKPILLWAMNGHPLGCV